MSPSWRADLWGLAAYTWATFLLCICLDRFLFSRSCTTHQLVSWVLCFFNWLTASPKNQRCRFFSALKKLQLYSSFIALLDPLPASPATSPFSTPPWGVNTWDAWDAGRSPVSEQEQRFQLFNTCVGCCQFLFSCMLWVILLLPPFLSAGLLSALCQLLFGPLVTTCRYSQSFQIL